MVVRVIARIAQSSVTHVLFAFLMMGGWALYANWQHPMPKPIVAGLVQGALSACLTYFLKSTLDALAQRMSRGYSFWLPPLIACSASLCILLAAHYFAGTPEIIRTISVPFSVATLYAVTYNLIMWKIRGRK